MKCVVTRDNYDGQIDFWELSADKLIKKQGGVLGTDSCKELLVSVPVRTCGQIDGVCKLLGFTPRRGSKQVVEITVKKLKT